MGNLSKDKVLVYDSGGIFVEQAARVARDVAQVKYFTPFVTAFPEFAKSKIGDGMDGLERVLWFEQHKKWADWIYVPDTHNGSLVDDLRNEGYQVAGAGFKGEQIELDRWHARTIQNKSGLPVQETRRIQGISNLRKFLQEYKRYYVKIDMFRGDCESFPHYDWKSSEDEVDLLSTKLGPFKEDQIFICEEMLDGEEPGLDGITWGKELLFPTMGGYEEKGVGIIERTYFTPQELPLALKMVHEGFSDEFEKANLRFFYSMEFKIDKSKQPFPIDPTIRHAAPGTSAIQTELIENFPEVLKGLATGQKVLPVIRKKYSAAAGLYSQKAEKSWVNILFPKEMRRWIKFRSASKKGSDYYAVPGFDSVATVIAIGDSIREVVDTVKDRVKEVKATRLSNNAKDLDAIVESINKAKVFGINF